MARSEAQKAKDREYYLDNRERKLAYDKAYNEANREAIKKRRAEYRRLNADKIKERNRNWYYANRDRQMEWKRNHYQQNREEILEAQKAWMRANPETVRERNLRNYWSDPEKHRETARTYWQQHREEICEKNRNSRQMHPEYYKLKRNAQRSKRKEVPASRSGQPWTSAEDLIVLNPELTLIEVCYMLSRTYDAVSTRRRNLKRWATA
jgi:hypothetical protein